MVSSLTNEHHDTGFVIFAKTQKQIAMTEEEYLTNKLWFFIEGENKSMIVFDTIDRVHKKVHLNWSSCSPGYESKKDLIKDQLIQDEPCKKCGNLFSVNYMEPTKSRLIEKGLCFHCDFWTEKLAIKDIQKVARIDGNHYMIERDDPTAYFKGFGGAEFKIRFNDGREVITHNLWFQGHIPEYFRNDLPNNAVFVNE